MKLIKLLITYYLLLFTVSTVFAVEEATNSSVTTKIKERLEKTAEQGLENIKEELTSQSLSPRRKAYVGVVKTVSKEQILLEYKSQSYPVYLDVVTLAKQDDFLLTLGFFFPDKNQFLAKKILVLDTPQPAPQRQLLTGQIEEIDGNKITVDNKPLTINTKTELAIQGITNPSTNDLELKDQIFAIVTLDKNGDIGQVKNVLVIPGKNNPAAMTPTNASESASPATDSADNAQ